MDAEHEDGFLSFWQDEMDIDDLVSNIILDSSSDEEENRQWGGSREGRAPNKERDFIAANERVVKNYFNGRQSKYDEKDFERRFRCSRAIFNKIHDAMMGKDPFIHKKDATGKLGIFPLVKLVACFRYIAYGDSHDREDENLEIGESTSRVICKVFAKMMVAEFGDQYLNRCPSVAERRAIGQVMAGKGFPGCLAS